jgi:hypothetical protein
LRDVQLWHKRNLCSIRRFEMTITANNTDPGKS